MESKVLIKHYAGSIAYGTNTQTSDIDFRGIFLADRAAITTPFGNIKEMTDETEEDTKLFELNFFSDLASTMNPNVIETLYIDPEHIVISTPEYEYLRENRDAFLNKQIAVSTSSYALQEMRKMKSHNKFINKPQLDEFPKQTNFIKMVQNFTSDKIMKSNFDLESQYENGYKLVPYGDNIFGLIKSEKHRTFTKDYQLIVHRDPNAVQIQPDFIVKFNKEEYERAKVNYKAYQSWKENRDTKKRSDIENKFGYDTKNAMHLVRLMRIGYETVTEGIYHVKRKDAKELLDIRAGAWSYETLIDYAEKMNEKIEKALINTKLPEKADIERIKTLIINIQNSGWGIAPLPFKQEIKKSRKLTP